MSVPPVAYKVVVVGSTGVGKSAIVQRLITGIFPTELAITCGADFHTWTSFWDGEPHKIQIWDTAGQERFRAISKAYFRNAIGAVLVFDITKRESFEDLANWIHDLEVLAAPNAYIILVANKTDLEGSRQVGKAETKLFAERHRFDLYETSALSGENINAVFARITLELAVAVKNGSIKLPQFTYGEETVEIMKPQTRRCC
jgi:small GTP-binding protein